MRVAWAGDRRGGLCGMKGGGEAAIVERSVSEP